MERVKEMSERSLSRRALLARGAAVTGAAALGAAPANAAKRRRRRRLKVFRLDPEWNDAAYCDVSEGSKPNGCHGCKACHLHGANKIFRSRKAANGGRAHAGCRCRVKGAGKLPRRKWIALFGKPRNPKRDSVDRRDRRVRKILNGD